MNVFRRPSSGRFPCEGRVTKHRKIIAALMFLALAPLAHSQGNDIELVAQVDIPGGATGAVTTYTITAVSIANSGVGIVDIGNPTTPTYSGYIETSSDREFDTSIDC